MSVIHGNYNNENIVPLLVDSSGRAIVTLGAGNENIGNVDVLTMPVTDVTSKGGDKIIAVEAVIMQQFSNTNLPAGTSYLDGYTVSAGFYWMINSIAIRYDGTIAGVTLRSVVYNSPYELVMQHVTPVVSGLFYIIFPKILLGAGNKIRMSVAGATAGDDIYLQYTGYQMKA